METTRLKNLWDEYKTFCSECAKNSALNPDSAPSFLGWMEYKDEIGNSRFIQGVGEGYAQAKNN